MIKTGKRLRHHRRFSEDFKLKVVHEYERGQFSVVDLGKIYDISRTLIYNWIYKYSEYSKKGIQVVEMKNSQAEKIRQMEARIKELERAVGQKQIKIDYLEKMIDLAKEYYNIDIKKNSNTQLSGGSKTTEKS
ncbi:MAG TPA: transposase [Salinivirgaceae bacterium]|nr:transposase [Salinivirgaceae bacterium]